MKNTQQSTKETLENTSLTRAYHAIMANASYRKAIEELDPDRYYVQTCTAHGMALIYGPFDSHDEANDAEYTYRDRGVHNPPPREVLRGTEIDPAQHGVLIRKYLGGEL